FNDFETVVDGANWFQVNRQADGTRASSSVSYLHPNLERENLHVLTGLQVMRVLFDEEQRATGVEYIDNAFDRSSIMHAGGEDHLAPCVHDRGAVEGVDALRH